jgi:GNAT superfamily N-acetyltransferase
MNIDICKLTPDLAEDYARFFDTTPHWDHTAREELPCYCVTWRSDDSYDDKNTHWYMTREERRERAVHFITQGKIQGYLAYHSGRMVGWCSVTADCRGGVDYLRAYYPIEAYRADVRVKSIFCFMVAPDMQRKGIAAHLVERVCGDAAADGYDFVEAYPNAEYTLYDCRGPLTMYEKCGFTVTAAHEGKVVVRKALKQPPSAAGG